MFRKLRLRWAVPASALGKLRSRTVHGQKNGKLNARQLPRYELPEILYTSTKCHFEYITTVSRNCQNALFACCNSKIFPLEKPPGPVQRQIPLSTLVPGSPHQKFWVLALIALLSYLDYRQVED